MTIDRQLFLHQLCDTQFPTGAFSQSFGFEYDVNNDKIKTAADFGKWLKVYLNQQLVYCEGLASRLIYEAPEETFESTLISWSDALYAQIVPEEIRYGNSQMGKQFLKLVCQLVPDAGLQTYRSLVQDKTILPHPAIVFGLTCKALDFSVADILRNYYYMSLYNLVQNAVRGIPIGQTSGQKLILSLHGTISDAMATTLSLNATDFGRTSPGLEIAQMKHHFLYSRSFMS